MIRLYGLPMSNYYSLAKALLIAKGVDFEEVAAPPSQEEESLRRSPMGKMPSIEVDGEFLSESLAIATYLDRAFPEPALLPADPFQAGKVMELVCHVKLDVELVARRCLPALLFNQPVSDEVRETTRTDLARGMNAVDRLLTGSTYACGETVTLADYFVFYTFGLASTVVEQVLDQRLLEGYEGIEALMTRLAQVPAISRVEAEKDT